MSNPIHDAMTEAQLQEKVVTRAKHLGWLHHHDRRQDLSIAGTAGFPDLVLARKGRIIFAELKREGEHPTPAQENWLAHLGAGTYPDGGVEVHVWRPSDWPAIEQALA